MTNVEKGVKPSQGVPNKVTKKVLVYITPASGVGGEFPRPIPFRSRRQARDYAVECRRRGMKVRVSRSAL